MRYLLFMLAVLLSPALGNAQTITLQSYVARSAGGTATGGQYSLSFTLGQAVAGDFGSSPTTSLGFWYAITPLDGSETRAAPRVSSVEQNVPNPFNPITTIKFAVRDGPPAPVRIVIYDTRGHVVQVLLQKPLPAGYHSVEWDGTDRRGAGAATGVYFYRIVIGDHFTVTKKFVLLK